MRMKWNCLVHRSTVPHQSWAVNEEWWRGMGFHWVRQNAPLPSTVLTSHFFDKLVVRLLRLMHISQKSFLPSFLYDLPVGHDKPLHASLYQAESFQDNANYDKFHHPALCAFLLISLIRENRGGSRCFSWGACCLTEWCWNCNPHLPHSVSLPSCDRLVSSVFLYLFLFLCEALSKSSWSDKHYPHLHTNTNANVGEFIYICTWNMNSGISLKNRFCIRLLFAIFSKCINEMRHLSSLRLRHMSTLNNVCLIDALCL